MAARIPTLDIRRFTHPASPADRQAFIDELGAAYREWGFAGIRNHGIPQAQIDEAYATFRAFFALPEETKKKYHVPGGGGARGYTAFGVETAKGAKYSDLKEFWHIGREIPRDSKYAADMAPNLWPDEVPGFQRVGYGLYESLDALGSQVLSALALHIGREIPRDSKYAGDMAPNLWPEEVPGFQRVGYGLYESLDALGSQVLSALALHIGLPEDYFADKTDSGNSILRPIHYPPITTDDIPNVRAGAHEDINLITLLVGASAAGLEVLSKKGEWVPFTSDADTIVVNIGDMLQRLTNHVYPSTTHRVTNPPGEAARQPRYSVPFFLHPNPDFLIDVLPSTITPDNPSRYPEPITAQGYLEERLREIKLK